MGLKLSSAVTYGSVFPNRFVRGEGVRIQDSDGRWYWDCVAGAGSLSLGHAHPVVEDAIVRVLQSGAPLQSLDLSTPWLDSFLAELEFVVPTTMNKPVVHLCPPSGAAAIEAALFVAKNRSGRSGVASIAGSFHGCTAEARRVSGSFALTPAESQWKNRFVKFVDEARPEPLNSIDGTHISDASSFIFEAVQGESGSRMLSSEWLREAASVARQSGTAIIADEIQCGGGRTGKFWGFEHQGVTPDLIVMSKAIGAGSPFAALILEDEFDVWGPSVFTGTFRGSTLGLACAAAFLNFCRTNNLPTQVAELGRDLKLWLETGLMPLPIVAGVRSTGLMAAVDLRQVSSSNLSLEDVARAVQAECLAQGLLTEVGGVDGGTIRLLPPLVVSRPELSAIVDVLISALQQVQVALGA